MAVARALANDLDILLVDESTGNLASRSGKDLLEFFEGLNGAGQGDPKVVIHSDTVAARGKQDYPDSGRKNHPRRS